MRIPPKQLLRLLWVSSVATVGWGFSCYAATTDTDAATTAAALEQTVEELNALDKWFSQAEKTRNNLQKQIRKLDRDIAALNTDIRTGESVARQQQRDIDATREQIDNLSQQVKAQTEGITAHLQAAYRLNGDSFAKSLLQSQSPAEIDRMVRYHGYFSAQRIELVEEYGATLAELETAEQTLVAQRLDQQKQTKALRGQQDKLDDNRQKRSSTIADLQKQSVDKEATRARLLADSERLQLLLQQLRARLGELDGSGFAAAKGSLIRPVSGKQRNAFGSKRSAGRLTWHGININAEAGTPVVSVYQGRVVFADWLRGFGLMVIVDHGSGYMTLYGNAEALLKKAGDWVEGGEAVANAGNSGGQGQSGIYFEVRDQGTAKDPASWLRR